MTQIKTEEFINFISSIISGLIIFKRKKKTNFADDTNSMIINKQIIFFSEAFKFNAFLHPVIKAIF